MISSACPQRSKNIQAIVSIVHVKRNSLLVFTALLPASPCINTETVASLADSLNLHNSTNCSIVLGPRISNEFYEGTGYYPRWPTEFEEIFRNAETSERVWSYEVKWIEDPEDPESEICVLKSELEEGKKCKFPYAGRRSL